MSTDDSSDLPEETAAAEPLPPAWQRVLHLACEVSVSLHVRDYCVGDVMKLAPGSVLDTRWKVGRDLPLCVNQQAVAWVEFEVRSGHLAVRVTELADDPGDNAVAAVAAEAAPAPEENAA